MDLKTFQSVSLIISFMTLTFASARFFYSHRIGIYGDVSPSFMSIVLIWPFAASVHASFIFFIILFFYVMQLYTLLVVFVCICSSVITTAAYKYYLKKYNKTLYQKFQNESRTNFFLVTYFTSWISPFTVLDNQSANKSKYFLLNSFSTVFCYTVPIITFHVTAPNFQKLESFFWALILLPSFSLIIMHFLGNYHFMYKVSKCCCCFHPIIHRSMIYNYLVNPELLGYKTSEETDDIFPDFFKKILHDNQINMPFPQNGDTVMHLAFQNGRFR